MRVGGDLERGHEIAGQLFFGSEEVAIEAPGVVLDAELLVRAVRHALLARVGPGERRLDAVGGIVGEGEADGAGGSDREQVRIADAVLANALLDVRGQARGEVAAREVEVLVEHREGATLARNIDRGRIGAVAHDLADLRGHGARALGVVAQAQHRKRVAQARIPESHAPLRARFGVLLRERPRRGFEDVVEHPDRHAGDRAECVEVEARALAERLAHEAREVDRSEAAATVGRQEFLGAGIRSLQGLAVIEVVVAIHLVEEQHARLGVVVRRVHHLVPQVARADLAIDPLPVAALVGARLLQVVARLGLVRELDLAVDLDRPHERVGHAHRDVEVGEVAGILGVYEALDVGVVAAQHPHLRAAARPGRFDRLAGLVEDAHVGHRAARTRSRPAHERALGPDRREVVAHAAAAAHRLGGLGERRVDTGPAVDDLGDRVADRLDEAVDEGGGE